MSDETTVEVVKTYTLIPMDSLHIQYQCPPVQILENDDLVIVRRWEVEIRRRMVVDPTPLPKTGVVDGYTPA